MGRVRFFKTHESVSYTMFESAKLMCQYQKLVDIALGCNEAFILWYYMQGKEDLELIKKDQKSRVAKQTGKYAGKVIGAVAGFMIGYSSFSKSPTYDIAEKAAYNKDIWFFLIAKKINYKELRKY